MHLMAHQWRFCCQKAHRSKCVLLLFCSEKALGWLCKSSFLRFSPSYYTMETQGMPATLTVRVHWILQKYWKKQQLEKWSRAFSAFYTDATWLWNRLVSCPICRTDKAKNFKIFQRKRFCKVQDSPPQCLFFCLKLQSNPSYGSHKN